MPETVNNPEYQSCHRDNKKISRRLSYSLTIIFCLSTALILILPGSAINSYRGKILNPVTETRDTGEVNLVLQVGAFVKETNATVFREKLSALIDKPVILVIEEGYYKVQLSGFKTIGEIEKIIPALGLIGIREYWIPPARKKTSVPESNDSQPATEPDNEQNDTVPAPSLENVPDPLIPQDPDVLITEEIPDDPSDTYALEIGTFRKKNRALNAQEKVISKLKLPVEIAEQWGDYHVIITGFTTKTEINKYIPEIAKMGYSEIYVLKNYKKSQ